jgi:hypothetical protein
MKINFCTLFNSAYLSRGIALYQSLIKHCVDFHLYVFAFDIDTYNYLTAQNLPHLTVISLKEFEDEQLLKIKPTRSAAEYCWTCTPSTILFTIEKFNLTNCTYIDADMLFYANPLVLIEEMGNKSILITEHRYTKEYNQSSTSGKYCVQFVTIKNNQQGLKVLKWWRDACIDWCYARHEDGKFGDQKYLDNWVRDFEGVHELQHLGGGVAPWNIQQYDFSINGNDIKLIEKNSRKEFNLVFFHFHGLRFYDGDIVLLTDTGYRVDNFVIKHIFFPYVKELMKIKKSIGKQGVFFNPNGSGGKSPMPPLNWHVIKTYYTGLIKSSRRNLLGSKLIGKIKQHYFYNANKL